MSTALFLYCRPGFEDECAAEIVDVARAAGYEGFCKAKPATGYVIFSLYTPIDANEWFDRVSLRNLAFTRQWFWIWALRKDLPLQDRVTPLTQCVTDAAARVGAEPFLETPDSDAHKALSPLCQALQRPLIRALHEVGAIAADSPWRLHVCFLATHTAYVGISPVANSSAWRGGVPRLKSPPNAPSRSTLKLDEAFLSLMNDAERTRWLQPGMTAVDLGASPGGWTYQFVRRHMRVTAVDNGAMAPSLMDSGLVEHLRVDGFTFRPLKKVTWMVCDMVEQPMRNAELAAQWVASGRCDCAVVNLKLPMKKRYAEVSRCLERMRDILASAPRTVDIRCKQLYHDRDEVTVCLIPISL